MVKEKIKLQKGITIVTLVITVILMLILVGVSVATTLDGRIFETTKDAADETQIIADKKELMSTIVFSTGPDGKIDWTLFDSNKPESFEGSKGVYTSKAGNTFVVTEEGNIEPRVELPQEIKVGDYVNYIPDAGIYKVADGTNGTGATTDAGYQTFTTEANGVLKWRVLSVDKQRGEIQLVSATVAQEQGLTLRGADGYNHGVDILNDLCRALYSKTVNGIKVGEARSINAEDINAKTSYDYTKTANYGVEFKYSAHEAPRRLYPNLYEQEEGFYLNGIKQTTNRLQPSEGVGDAKTDKETGITEYTKYTGYTNGNTENKDISVTNTSYAYQIKGNLRTDLGDNNAPNGLINISSNYWVATRQCNSDNDYSYFAIKQVNSQNMFAAYNLFDCYHVPPAKTYGVRPVVILKSNYSIRPDTQNTDTENTYWNLEF